MAGMAIPTRASVYYIRGEDVARAAGDRADCPYFAGSIAHTEWMAGFGEGEAGQLDLTAEMQMDATADRKAETFV